MKKKEIAALFAFLLGGVGGHHFYLGNVGRGILYLLFCWTFIPAFVSFVEMIVFLVSSEEKFNHKYNVEINGDKLSALSKLHALKKDGAITDEEFNTQKKRLIA